MQDGKSKGYKREGSQDHVRHIKNKVMQLISYNQAIKQDEIECELLG